MEEKLRDITDCCICLETYREPRILPCIHTFCLNCLEKAGAKTNICPRDEMPCPVCRKEFSILENGFSGLQKNFFMDRLVEITKVLNPSVDRILCDLCSEDGDPVAASEIPSAEVYCGDCHQKLCQECCRHHRKHKLSKSHKIVDLEDQMISQGCIESTSPNFCDQHNGKALEIYCLDCQEVVCAICFFEIHKTHEGIHVNSIVDDFRKQIRKSTELFPKYVTDLVEGRNTAEKDIAAYMRKTENIETEINSTREELKQRADRNSEDLILQQKLLKQERLKEFEIQKDETETVIASLESFEAYCKQITTMGSASDICGAVGNLNKRAEELSYMYKAKKQTGMQTKNISFRKTAILNSDDENIIGKIDEDGSPWTPAEVQPGPSYSGPESSRSIACQASLESDEECDKTEDSRTEDLKDVSYNALKEQLMEKAKGLEQELESMKQNEIERNRVEKSLRNYKPTPYKFKTITKTITSTGCVTVTGMTILDNELFIATKNNNDIEVYDSMNYSFKRLLRVSELHDPWDMCSCSRHKCIYIANGYNYSSEDMRFEAKWESFFQQRPNNFYGKILKVNLLGSLQLSWYIGDDYGTLSITCEGNVILTVPVGSRIVVYDADGTCLREINISTDYNLKVLTWYPPSYIICPSHAENLRNCNFVVSFFIFENKSHSVNWLWEEKWSGSLSSNRNPRSYKRYPRGDGLCVINPEGQIISVFPGGQGSGFGELQSPWYLAVDKDMAVLVLERRNKRISLLYPNLVYMRKVISTKHGLSNPYRLCLDEKYGRLLVTNSDSEKDHVLVYEIIKQ